MALLTRYDVVVKSMREGVELLASEDLPRDGGTGSDGCGHVPACRHSETPADDREAVGERPTRGDVGAPGQEASGPVKEVSAARGEHCPEVEGGGSDGPTVTDASTTPAAGSACSATATVSGVKGPGGDEGFHDDARRGAPVGGHGEQANVGAPRSPVQCFVGSVAAEGVAGMGHSMEASACPTPTEELCSGASGTQREAEADEKELLEDARKACEDAFLELLSDERTR